MAKLQLDMTYLRGQKKFMITMSAATIAFLVWLLAFQLPLSRDYEETRNELQRLETSNAEIRTLQSRLGDLVEQRNKSVGDYGEMLTSIPDSKGFSQSVGAVSVLASEHDLKTEMFNPSAVSIESERLVPVGEFSRVQIEKYPINVSFKGDYRDFGLFLDDLEKLPNLYTVENLIIEPTLDGEELKLDMVIYAYLQREVG